MEGPQLAALFYLSSFLQGTPFAKKVRMKGDQYGNSKRYC